MILQAYRETNVDAPCIHATKNDADHEDKHLWHPPNHDAIVRSLSRYQDVLRQKDFKSRTALMISSYQDVSSQ